MGELEKLSRWQLGDICPWNVDETWSSHCTLGNRFWTCTGSRMPWLLITAEKDLSIPTSHWQGAGYGEVTLPNRTGKVLHTDQQCLWDMMLSGKARCRQYIWFTTHIQHKRKVSRWTYQSLWIETDGVGSSEIRLPSMSFHTVLRRNIREGKVGWMYSVLWEQVDSDQQEAHWEGNFEGKPYMEGSLPEPGTCTKSPNH